MLNTNFILLYFGFSHLNDYEHACVWNIIQWSYVQDICLSSTRVAFEFYHAARDVILLYEAIVPVKVSAWRNWCNFQIYLKNHLIM